MKRLLLLLAAALVITGANANLILHESFDRTTGDLNKGDFQEIGNNTTDWFWFLSGSTDIQVVDGSLAFPNYVPTGIGKKAYLQGGSGKYKDLRQFKSINTGHVYVAAIINVQTLKTATTADYFLALGDMTASNMYARIYTSSVQEGDNWTGFKLGIQKNNENNNARGYSETIYSPNTDYLIVAEYEFVDGAQNDTVRLYVNPTKDKKVPVAQCGQVYMIGDNNKGAGAQPDAAYLSSVNLRPSIGTPTAMYVDEIKVATTWEALFAEGGDTPIEPEPTPEITTTPSKLSFARGMPYAGETYTATFTVTGTNLKGDITLASNNSELTLDKTTITKAEAESESGVVVTATLTPVAVDKQSATITLTTTDATATVTSTWWTTALTTCATVAELKTTAATATGWDYAYMKFTGGAVVTYKFTDATGAITLYLEDNTGAISVSDMYWNDAVQQGDKITNFAASTYADAAVGGILPIMPLDANVIVLSRDNDVTPQVVTLAELKANAADYLLELVKVEGVTFDNTDPMASSTKIQQGENTATINLVAGNELIGATKPAKADITGISSSTTGTVIRMRGAADLKDVSVGTGIEHTTVTIPQDAEIYTLSGQRVNTLQPGVNIIRTAEKTYKVAR